MIKLRKSSNNFLSNKINRTSKEFILIGILLLPISIIKWHSLSGDSAVYFTYFKNFFSLPFSYHKDSVTFAATSPFFVILFAPIYKIFSESNWIIIAKIINISFIYIGVLLINKSVKGNYLTISIICLLVTSLTGLFETSAKLFETSLAFTTVIMLYYLISNKRFTTSLLLSGSLYLIRPELITITLVSNIYILYTLIKQRFNLKKYLLVVLASFIPLAIYHLYMFIHTNKLI